MQKQVLEYLSRQGGLILYTAFGKEINLEALEKVALALNAGAPFVVLDFSGQLESRGTTIPVSNLFEHILRNKELETLVQEDAGNLVLGGRSLPVESDENFRKFYHNLEEIKKYRPYIIGVISSDVAPENIEKIGSITKCLIVDAKGDESGIDDAGAFLEDSAALRKIPLVYLAKQLPLKKKFPHGCKAIKQSFSSCKEFQKLCWEDQPEKFAESLKLLIKANILKRNPLDGFLKIFRRLFLFFVLIAVAIPFLVPTDIDFGVSNVRDRVSERNALRQAPSFEYTFDGREPMQRIARYAIGRFNAIITDEKLIRQYVEETLNENGYEENAWLENNVNIPPAGTVIKFSRSENIMENAVDSLGNAWRYWGSIVSDSINYLTEYYHEKASSQNRQHNGIDLASRQGARILAPFSAKAWTSKDERGGIIIGLVREKDVILFMHCDQLLYLDGQEVMQGDPIATVGVTGHTTGPHAHIVTGIIDKKGSKHIGNVKYRVIDPMKWYDTFKPKAQ